MTDFSVLLITLTWVFLFGLAILVLCVTRQKRKCCRCKQTVPDNANMTTSVELDDMRHQACGRPRSVLLSDMSHRSDDVSHCEVSEASSDPGMDHINRFLGRSLSDEPRRNVYEGESDAGVLHIRRALGLMNADDVDPGTAHVRRALGMVNDIRNNYGPDPRHASVPNSQSASSDLASHRPLTESHGLESRITDMDANAASSLQNLESTTLTDTYSDGSHVDAECGSNVNTIDRLPSYEEALDILAKINEPEEPPPSYDDAVSHRLSRTTDV